MKMQDTGKNIIIAGVGGQGILLFSNLLSKYYMKLGYELKISDVIGLGQRGGGVESHFRYSTKPVMWITFYHLNKRKHSGICIA